MKRRFVQQSLAVLLLICVDQSAKLFVKAFASADSQGGIFVHGNSGWFWFRIYPELHDKYSLPMDIAMILVAIVLMSVVIVFFTYERFALLRGIPNAEDVKSSPKITGTAICLSFSGLICGIIFDSLLWGGSLDFICFEWARFVTDVPEPYTLSYHYNFDLKDVYLILGALLICVRYVIWQISLKNLTKSDQKLVSRRSTHFIKSILEAKGETVEDYAGKNSVWDMLVIVLFTLFFSAGVGAFFYVATVWVIIPIAVWLSPAADVFLTEIGKKYDAEVIYSVIKNLCLLAAVFPAVCLSNSVVKNRERYFISDTSGMISEKDGLGYHFRRHFTYDVISVAAVSVICLIIYLAFSQNYSPFGILYRYFGIPAGFIFSIAITAVAQIFGVIYAQKKWRAEYFYQD